ncbi:MAG: TonB-dependent receptor [Rhizobium sp.]|nr:TonB-dependent receptor [Rhizobium sp.]
MRWAWPREPSDGFNAKPSGNPDRDGYRSQSVSGSGWAGSFAPRHELEATLLDSDHGRRNTTAFFPVRTTRASRICAPWDSAGRRPGATPGKPAWLSTGGTEDRYETTAVALPHPHPHRHLPLAQSEWRMGTATLSADLERREDRLMNGSTTPEQTDRDQNALALGYTLRSGAHTLQLNARHDEDSEFGGQSTGGAAYAYAFTPAWRATLSAGHGLPRAHAVPKRFSLYGTPDLKAETAHNFELGCATRRA